MQDQRGSTVLLVMTIVFATATVVFGGLGVWAFLNYQNQKNNVDAIVSTEVIQAKQEQKAADDAAFTESEKSPLRQFVGPADLGLVSFEFPKTWSVYVAEDGSLSSGGYDAYFHPGAVANPERLQPYALRLNVVNVSYESAILSYQDAIQTGQVAASAITLNGQTGTRFDGAINEQSRGSMVMFKLRDKTIELYTESEAFVGDFNNIVLSSLKFNP